MEAVNTLIDNVPMEAVNTLIDNVPMEAVNTLIDNVPMEAVNTLIDNVPMEAVNTLIDNVPMEAVNVLVDYNPVSSCDYCQGLCCIAPNEMVAPLPIEVQGAIRKVYLSYYDKTYSFLFFRHNSYVSCIYEEGSLLW